MRVLQVLVGGVCRGDVGIPWLIHQVKWQCHSSACHHFKGRYSCGLMRGGPNGHEYQRQLDVPVFVVSRNIPFQYVAHRSIGAFDLP